jgi:hypothetical protein
VLVNLVFAQEPLYSFPIPAETGLPTDEALGVEQAGF